MDDQDCGVARSNGIQCAEFLVPNGRTWVGLVHGMVGAIELIDDVQQKLFQDSHGVPGTAAGTGNIHQNGLRPLIIDNSGLPTLQHSLGRLGHACRTNGLGDSGNLKMQEWSAGLDGDVPWADTRASGSQNYPCAGSHGL